MINVGKDVCRQSVLDPFCCPCVLVIVSQVDEGIGYE